jgi:hypothetical protein
LPLDDAALLFPLRAADAIQDLHRHHDGSKRIA